MAVSNVLTMGSTESFEVVDVTSPEQRLKRLFLAIGVVTGFLPYVAIPYGHSSAFQLSQLSLIAAGLFGARAAKRRLILLSFLLILPLSVSLALLTFQTNPVFSTSIGLKYATNLVLSMAAVLGAAAVTEAEDFLILLRSLTAALLINSAFGLVQFVGFRHHSFPFQAMYRMNPTFASWDPTAIQAFLNSGGRPFGAFSEPSAMAACIGPWLAMTIIIYFILERLGVRISLLQRTLTFAGISGGALLVAFSQSGMSLFALVGLFGCIAVFAMKSPNREAEVNPFPRSEGLHLQKFARRLVILAIVVAPIGVAQLMNRAAGGTANSSWTLRWNSIQEGFHLWFTSVHTFVVGTGPGQVPRLFVVSAPGIIKFYGFVKIVTIWSILINYIVEVGVIGLIVWLFIVVKIAGAVRLSRIPKVASGIVFFLWFVGVVATTSYSTLTPVWLLLGFLFTWDLLPTAEAVALPRNGFERPLLR